MDLGPVGHQNLMIRSSCSFFFEFDLELKYLLPEVLFPSDSYVALLLFSGFGLFEVGEGGRLEDVAFLLFLQTFLGLWLWLWPASGAFNNRL